VVSQNNSDLGVITVLLRRVSTQRLPRIMALKERVDRGERLDHYDLNYLEHVLKDTQRALPIVERHPEYQPLACKLITLYREVIDKALENEEQRG